MLDQYRESCSKVSCPDTLIKDTKELMAEELELQKNKKKRRWLVFGGLGFVLASLVLVALLPQDKNTIQTEFQFGKTIEKIELDNGELYFEQLESIISSADSYDEVKEGTQKDVTDFYGEEPTLDQYFDKQKKKDITLLYKNHNLTNVSIQTQYEDNITVIIKKSQTELIQYNSFIGDTKIQLSYSPARKEYTAIYTEDDLQYTIVGTDVSQKEYVEKLVEILE